MSGFDDRTSHALGMLVEEEGRSATEILTSALKLYTHLRLDANVKALLSEERPTVATSALDSVLRDVGHDYRCASVNLHEPSAAPDESVCDCKEGRARAELEAIKRRWDCLRILEDLYSREINVQISCFYDEGWTAKIGDPINGFKSESGGCDSLGEAVEWLAAHTKP